MPRSKEKNGADGYAIIMERNNKTSENFCVYVNGDTGQNKRSRKARIRREEKMNS